jgi:hypothetical protein
MESERIYIQVGQDLPDVLEDSEEFKKAVLGELKQDGVEAEVTWQHNPTSIEADREVVLLILAVGATALMVGTAVKRVIDALNRGNPTVVVTKELTPALDKNGNPIRDRAGNPVFVSKETPAVFGSAHESDTTQLKAGTLFEFRSVSGQVAAQGKSGQS